MMRVRDAGGAFTGRHPRRRAALRDRAVEQPARGGSAEQRSDARRAGRLAEDRHLRRDRRRTRRCNRAPNRARRSGRGCRRCPSPGTRRVEVGEVQEAERSEAVVDRDDDDVAVQRELRTVVPRCVARAPDVRAAVNPHHHRSERVVARGCPHVEVEAVFAVGRLGFAHQLRQRELGLRRLRGERGRGAGAGPRLFAAAAPASGAGRPAAPRTGCRGTRARRRVRSLRSFRCASPRSSWHRRLPLAKSGRNPAPASPGRP